jgi:predicted RNA binding protein YcfA (HicA-like mRNA interferase family)
MRHALRELLRAAEARGWRVELTRRGAHVRLTHPAGGIVFAASTPSDCRALANLRAQLRRAEKGAATCATG